MKPAERKKLEAAQRIIERSEKDTLIFQIACKLFSQLPTSREDAQAVLMLTRDMLAQHHGLNPKG